MERLQAGGGCVGMLWESIPANGKNVLEVSWFSSHSEQQRVETTFNKPFRSKSSDSSFHHHLWKKCPLSSQWAVFLPAAYLPYSVRYPEKAIYVFGQKKYLKSMFCSPVLQDLNFIDIAHFCLNGRLTENNQPSDSFSAAPNYLVSSKL